MVGGRPKVAFPSHVLAITSPKLLKKATKVNVWPSPGSWVKVPFRFRRIGLNVGHEFGSQLMAWA